MLRIGLTGGIGSGKSIVAKLFSYKGVTIIDADVIAHELTSQSTVINELAHHFGDEIFTDDSVIDRRALRKIIFQDPQQKKWLENKLHPLIREEMRNQIDTASSPYCILVIPLLAESKGIDYIDRILVVDAPPEQQIQRARMRDGVTESDIQAIMNSQADRKKRLAIADDVITNDSTLEDLEQIVLQLHNKYLKLAEG